MKTKAQVTKILDGYSQYGGTYKLICFKDLLTGKSAKTFVYSNCFNKKRWDSVLKIGRGCIISNFIYKNKSLIDADSLFEIVKENSYIIN